MLASGDPILARLMLEPERWALFLDIDGTLIDLAETPDGIVVPPDLPENLHRLSMKLGGAVALVTGRALPYADQLFAPYKFPIAGLHGSERRDPSGSISRIEVSAAFEDLKAALVHEARQWPGVLVEDKGLPWPPITARRRNSAGRSRRPCRVTSIWRERASCSSKARW